MNRSLRLLLLSFAPHPSLCAQATHAQPANHHTHIQDRQSHSLLPADATLKKAWSSRPPSVLRLHSPPLQATSLPFLLQRVPECSARTWRLFERGPVQRQGHKLATGLSILPPGELIASMRGRLSKGGSFMTVGGLDCRRPPSPPPISP